MINLGVGIGCCLLIAGLTVLTLADVVGRYWLNAPVRGAFELTQLMLCALVFAALPLTTHAKGHVEVDIFYGLVPPVGQNFMRFVSSTFSCVVLGILAWRLGAEGLKLGHDGAVTNALDVPYAPLAWLAALCTALAALYAFQLIFTAFRRGY
ncbi:TRAP transporter small permease [Rhodobacteraceae bacterium RKSG542]|nr:TRAP transporter small permease [Pseudovibrio flavus]MTI16157.1 TRAP transporter small permease [Pseudovibrio flavus]